MTRLERLQVDFGEVSEDGRLTGLAGKRAWVIGQPVLLLDGDGNLCSGSITEIVSNLVFVTPNWETWIPADRLNNPLPAQRSTLGSNVLRFTTQGAGKASGNSATALDEPSNTRLSFA